MEAALLQKINDQTNIVDLVSEYVELTKAGKNLKGLCPFHQEKTPSFFVSPEKNIAKCMSCQTGGQPITFYKEIKGISLQEAANELAIRAGIIIEDVKKDPLDHIYKMFDETIKFYQFSLMKTEDGAHALSYLKNRAVKDETIQSYQLGYAPKKSNALYSLLRDKKYDVSDMLNYGLIRQSEEGTYYDLFLDKIIFPIHNEKGLVVGLSGRSLKKDDAVKYINSPESKIFKKSNLIYHLYQALPSIRKQKRIILTEGYLDVIAMDQAGFHETVATMGTSLTKEHVSLLSQITDNIILAYDGDQAGNQATLKAIEAFNKTKVKLDVLIFPEQLDPDEFIKKHGVQALKNHIEHHLKDPFDYRYDMYKHNRDLKNSHDMVAFKDDIIKMIKDADPSVQALYKERLAIELNIDAALIQVKSKNNPSLQIKKKETKKALPNRYFLSEVGLIIAMMQDKKYAIKASNELSNNHFADSHMAVLRYQIIKHYESHAFFEIEAFKKQLKDDYLLKFESNVLNDLDYIKKLKKDDKMVEEYIAFIKQSITQRRIDKLIEKRKEHPENAILYVSERDTLIKNMNGDIKS